MRELQRRSRPRLARAGTEGPRCRRRFALCGKMWESHSRRTNARGGTGAPGWYRVPTSAESAARRRGDEAPNENVDSDLYGETDSRCCAGGGFFCVVGGMDHFAGGGCLILGELSSLGLVVSRYRLRPIRGNERLGTATGCHNVRGEKRLSPRVPRARTRDDPAGVSANRTHSPPDAVQDDRRQKRQRFIASTGARAAERRGRKRSVRSPSLNERRRHPAVR